MGYSAIVQRFGTAVLGADKEIDPRKLAAEVFSDPRKLDSLERILHPRVIARVLEARSMLRDGDALVVEAIKLLDTSLRTMCDRVWVVLATREVLLQRLAQRGMKEEDALLRLQSQASDEQFRAAADLVIVNDGDREALRDQVVAGWEGLRSP